MTVESEKDLQGLREIGRICALALEAMHKRLVIGVTTGELDAIAAEFLGRHGARSAPRLPFPHLKEGMVITIEPFLTTGARRVREDPNGWTLHTADGGLSAQFEHTLMITRGRPVVITSI